MATTPLEQLSKLARGFDKEVLTKEDFVKSFKNVVVSVDKIRREFNEKINKFEREAEKLLKNVESDTKEETKKVISDLRSELKTELGKLQKEQAVALNFLKDRVSALRDGKDADEEAIVERLVEMIPDIPEFEPETPIETRNKLESLKGDDRLDKAAIRGLEEEFEAIRSMRLGKAGGGVTDLGVKASLSRSVRTETPSGDIDGANTTYTVTSNINAVMSFAINGMVIHSDEYTTTGKTIEFTTALPAALSGTSFEIIYV